MVADHLAVPWGVAFLPDGTALVTERDTRRVLAIAPSGRVREVGLVEEAAPQGEAGLLGIAVPPDWSRGDDVFLYVTTTSDNRILRAPYDGRRLGPTSVVLDGIPAGFIHDGGRLAFGPDGYLYASTGETGDSALAQDRGTPGRQDPADHHRRRARARQPRPRLAGVDVGPPQRAGPRLRRRRSAVGLGVRRPDLRRAQPDREGEQLRLARGRGPRGRPGVHEPAGRLGDRAGLPQRPGLARRPPLARGAAR